MGLLTRAVGALFGIRDDCGYTENADRLDYGNGADAALSLGLQEAEDGGGAAPHKASLRAGRTPGFNDHMVELEHSGVENMGAVDVAELAGEYKARSVEAFQAGFEDQRDRDALPRWRRGTYSFLEDRNM